MKKRTSRISSWLTLILVTFCFQALAFETNSGQKSWPKFALRINAGLTNINGGDLNLMIEETNRLASELNQPGTVVTSNLKKIKRIPSLQAEFFYFPLKNLAFSLATDYFYVKDRRGWLNFSSLSRTLEAPDYFINRETEFQEKSDLNLKNLGFMLRLYYFVNLTNKFQLYIKVGPALYHSSIKLLTELNEVLIDSRFVLTSTPGEYVYQSSEIFRSEKSFLDEAGKWYPGWQAGLGLQFNISPRQSLVLEADYRSARTGKIKSQGTHFSRYKYEYQEDWTSSNSSLEGYLRYVKVGDVLMIDTIATSDPNLEGISVRNASLNISGLVVKAGLRFKL
jgi:opacity protein-like surface antigen